MHNHFYEVVLDFLNSNGEIDHINESYITLIPKIKTFRKVSDYRPISLYNVIYKLISKVLANGMKTSLPDVISPT